jgi:hypothetical protein
MKTTFINPELFVDSHHGIYMYKFMYECLNERYKKQLNLSPEDVAIICNPEHENYIDVAEDILNFTFKTKTGQKWQLECNEDIWAVPYCYMRTKEYQNWYI